MPYQQPLASQLTQSFFHFHPRQTHLTPSDQLTTISIRKPSFSSTPNNLQFSGRKEKTGRKENRSKKDKKNYLCDLLLYVMVWGTASIKRKRRKNLFRSTLFPSSLVMAREPRVDSDSGMWSHAPPLFFHIYYCSLGYISPSNLFSVIGRLIYKLFWQTL